MDYNSSIEYNYSTGVLLSYPSFNNYSTSKKY